MNGMNGMGVALCVGTGYVMRRTALDSMAASPEATLWKMFTAIHMRGAVGRAEVFGMSKSTFSQHWRNSSSSAGGRICTAFRLRAVGSSAPISPGSDDLRGLFELLVHLDHPGYHPWFYNGDWCHNLAVQQQRRLDRPIRYLHHTMLALMPRGPVTKVSQLTAYLMFVPRICRSKVGHWQTQPQRYVYKVRRPPKSMG
jgi:hypothetical protein